ncbi:MAG: M48 family metallopeptidase, partial [Candidatus Pacearchaeota archaeon]|nr:M48 family metallopeptidase [Candidatus Pacearchaeota archaeon]
MKSKKISVEKQIQKNKIKSFLLLAGVFAVIILIGYLISFAFSPQYFFIIMLLSSIFALLYILLLYSNCEKIALRSVNAREASKDKFRVLHEIVEKIASRSGIPKPKIFIMPGEQINAFATGRNPKKAVICVTEGCIKKLNKEELEGVIAHEISHIKNYDVKYMTIVAVVVGAVSIFSQLFLRSLWFSDNRKEGSSLLFLIAIVLAIVAPIVVMLMQFAISRKREFIADASAAGFVGSHGLISALRKIKEDEASMKVPQAMRSLFFRDTSKKISNIFA